ncbi:MAG: oligosaccharide flippase family protein [Actinomycetota bacterium]
MSVRAALTAAGRRLPLGDPRAAQLGGTIFSSFVGQLALLVSGVLSARLLGPEGRGHVALFIIVALITVQVTSLGVPTAVTYELGRRGTSATDMMRRLLGLLVTQFAATAAIHGGVIALIVSGSPGEVKTAGWVSVAVGCPMLLQAYGQGLLLGAKRYRAFNITRLLPSVGFAVGVAVVVFLSDGDIVEVIVGWVAATWLAAGVTLVAALRAARGGARNSPPSRVRDLVRFGLRGLLGSASPVETFQMDQAVVGLFLSPVALGLYSVAVALTNLPRFLGQSVATFAYAETAAMPSPRGRRAIWRFTAVGAVLSLAVVLVIELFAESLVSLFFGDAFRDSVSIVRILLVGSLFLAVRRVLAEGARGLGEPMLSTRAEVVSWLALLPLLALLAPTLGADGVAIAMALSSGISLIVLAALLRGDLGQAATRFGKTD